MCWDLQECPLQHHCVAARSDVPMSWICPSTSSHATLHVPVLPSACPGSWLIFLDLPSPELLCQGQLWFPVASQDCGRCYWAFRVDTLDGDMLSAFSYTSAIHVPLDSSMTVSLIVRGSSSTMGLFHIPAFLCGRSLAVSRSHRPLTMLPVTCDLCIAQFPH